MSEDTKFEDIKGVGHITAEKLRGAGISSIEELAVTPIREIMEKQSSAASQHQNSLR